MKTNLALMKYHSFSYSDIESMWPWERLVYVDLISQKIQEEAMEYQDKLNAQRDNQNAMIKRMKR